MRPLPGVLFPLLAACIADPGLSRESVGQDAAFTVALELDSMDATLPLTASADEFLGAPGALDLAFLSSSAGTIVLGTGDAAGFESDPDVETIDLGDQVIPLTLPDALLDQPEAFDRVLTIVEDNAAESAPPEARKRSSALRRTLDRWRAMRQDGRRAWRSADIRLSGMGDSISQGFNARHGCGLVPSCPDVGFGQGTVPEVDSLFSRYQREGSAARAFFSYSGSGWVKHLWFAEAGPRQAESLCSMRTAPNRVVILLGACDVCQSDTPEDLPEPAQIREAVRATLDTLAADSCGLPEGSRVLVLSVPDLPSLQAAARAKGGEVHYCSVVKNASAEQLAQIRTRLHAWNDAIAEEVAAADARVGARVHFLTDWRGPSAISLGTTAFQGDDISPVDFLHPWFTTGQRKLACWAWQLLETDHPDPFACL